MSMPGMKSSIFRMVGKVINALCMILLIVWNFVTFSALTLSNVFILLGILGVFGLFFVEKDFVDEYRVYIMLAVIAVSYIVSLIGVLTSSLTDSGSAAFVLILFAVEFLSPLYQQYSLSIYKNEKMMFLIFWVIMIAYFTVYQVLLGLDVFLLIIEILLVVAAIMILAVEKKMKDKKLLNYI